MRSELSALGVTVRSVDEISHGASSSMFQGGARGLGYAMKVAAILFSSFQARGLPAPGGDALSTVLCPLSSVHDPLSTIHRPLSSVLCPLSSVQAPLRASQISQDLPMMSALEWSCVCISVIDGCVGVIWRRQSYALNAT